MALPILDGNQSATTLSTILSSGQHITAHTVVSLGTQAITDIVNATSAGLTNTQLRASAVTIAGTVTANVFGQNQTNFFQEPIPVDNYANTRANAENDLIVPVQITNDSGTLNASNPLPVSGTVTANGGTEIGTTGNQSGIIALGVDDVGSANPLILDGNGNLAISGTVTIGSALPAGTNRIGVVTIGGGTVTIGAGTAQIGVVTIGNIRRSTDGATTQLTTEVGSGYLEVRSYIGAGTAQIGSVTASLAYSQTATTIASTAVTAIPVVFPTSGAYGGSLQGYNGTNTYIYSGIQAIGNTSLASATSLPVSLGSLPALVASTAQIGSVTASISNSVVTFYPLQGTTVSNTNFTSTTASTTLASAVAGREVLTVFSEGPGNLFISSGATCTTISYQVRLSAGDYWECPQGQLSLIHSAVFATAGTARICQVS
jgi:hypothetical protein